jgi:predicted nucleotide-binding protein (sugar kinase/HSP70/actin superfamily)
VRSREELFLARRATRPGRAEGARMPGTPGRPNATILPLLDEAALAAAVSAERDRLLEQAGLRVGPVSHFRRPEERPFTRAERERVTILFGGLTTRHEELVFAGLEGLGYRVARVPTPRKADFQAGKEYGNNGQCNPTYFTVGALVNYLKDLRDRQGLSREQVVDEYVFITAGACGPCRFGMYEAEYRLALENSGFAGFRVLLFQQSGGLNQAELEAGIDFNLDFFLTLLNALFIGDLLNEVAYQIRPYETVPGKTDEVAAKCLHLCQTRLRSKSYDDVHGGAISRILHRLTPLQSGDEAAKFLDQLRSDFYVGALRECARMLQEEVEVDFTRLRPRVKITGEFWAQTTEGDGNFQMFRFLEEQGAEVLVEPVATWISYMLNQARTKAKDRRGLDAHGQAARTIAERLAAERRHRAALLRFALAERVLTREYERLRHALGGTAHRLLNQLELQRMAHPYYNTRAGGGEGHLEVAKSIYYSNRQLAHMVLSLKPFGCMPSTQSDGAHAAVMAHFPELLFLPIETSGEGDINAHSRVQMALGEAKGRARSELKAAVESTGYSLDEIRAYADAHRNLRRPLQHIAARPGIVGRAAQFCLHVGALMAADPDWKARPAHAVGTSS